MLATRPPAPTVDAPADPVARVPGLCAVCRSWGRRGVCMSCSARFAPVVPRCTRCALEVPDGVAVCGSCLMHPPVFDSALACFDYGAPWNRLITAFKFHGALELSPFFATTLVAQARRLDTALPTLVVPVPLAAGRLRERGYNQAWELGRRVARALALHAEAQLLLRTRETAHQLDLPPSSRAGNVRGAFAVEPRRRGEIAGQRIALVDDVMTTGSTADEIATVLKQAGAVRVDVWVLARTPRPDDR